MVGYDRDLPGWAVVPHSLRDLLVSLRHQCADALPPILITENGSAEDDVLSADGHIHDPGRIEYLRDHMAAVANAVAEGVDVRCYYVWSLLDNYEWAFGYDRRFGILHVDYDTLRRTPKYSYRWHQQLIAAKA